MADVGGGIGKGLGYKPLSLSVFQIYFNISLTPLPDKAYNKNLYVCIKPYKL
jgi:hypothetical protein